MVIGDSKNGIALHKLDEKVCVCVFEEQQKRFRTIHKSVYYVMSDTEFQKIIHWFQCCQQKEEQNV